MQNGNELPLERCPHCGVVKPRLAKLADLETANCNGRQRLYWYFYGCSTCGGVVMTAVHDRVSDIRHMWPTAESVSDAVPDRAREFLTQAIASLHAPAGALMLTASSLDAMLKEKGYKSGSLYARIDQAKVDHLITEEMALWAHEIRLDANDQRHADENVDLPTQSDARRAIDFAQALAEFLFVLPARVDKGRSSSAVPTARPRAAKPPSAII